VKTKRWQSALRGRSSFLLKLSSIVLAGLAVAGCAPKRAVVHQPAAIPEYETLFAEGQAAFREATPEGYERAADAFRKASSLRPRRCSFSRWNKS
jgi:hypothetical protein